MAGIRTVIIAVASRSDDVVVLVVVVVEYGGRSHCIYSTVEKAYTSDSGS